jgi:MOSC domain-containing protein YiiM
MTMRIVQVCVGRPAAVEFDGKTVSTGIFKSPVVGKVEVRWLNLAGDGQADLTVHGGSNKAVYVYSQDHYEYWAKEIGVAALEDAQFGENLTVAGLSESDVIIGDRYKIGSAIVTVTQPRLPCFKLGVRVGDAAFPRRFLESGRLGMYLRVEEEGVLQCGDTFDLIERPAHGISLHALWRMVFRDDGDANLALQHLAHLDAGWLRRLRRKSAVDQ